MIDIRRILCILSLLSIFLGVWISWEAVVKPLKSIAPNAWGKDFPSPFYFWNAPIWVWHDLYILIILVGASILAYYALKPMK